MARKRRARAWWQATVARWRRSGRTAAEFAEREGLSTNTLQWWSSRLVSDTRAEHGSPVPMPIEIAVPEGGTKPRAETFEIAIGEAVVRCEVGTDVVYVAALVRALRGS